MRSLLVPLVCLLGLLASACGGGGQNRPEVVSSFPAQNEALPGLVREIRVTFNEPVRILTPTSVEIYTENTYVPLQFQVDPNDANSILFEPFPGFTFVPGTSTMRIGAGFEVNGDDHYRLEDYVLRFKQGLAFSAFFAVPAPASVVDVDASTFTVSTTTPTPGGRVPIGLAGSSIATTDRMWVQLASGAGTGRSLAWFPRGATSMTEVALSNGGGDLVAVAPAIALGGDGRTLYAAWRDTALGQVRVHAVDVATGLEVGTAVLSAPASPDTRPLSLIVTYENAYVDLSVRTGTEDLLFRLDAATLDELDLTPSAAGNGIPFEFGAGSIGGRSSIGLRVTAIPGRTTADLTAVNPQLDLQSSYTSPIPGAPGALFVTPDGTWVLQGLSGYADDDALAVRFTDTLDVAIPVKVEATFGDPLTPAATRVVAMTNYPGTLRTLVVFDNDVLASVIPANGTWVQEDLDTTVSGVQGVDISSVAPGATFVAFPPPTLAPED